MHDFAYGVDVSWVSQLEAQGIYWIDCDGQKADPIALLKTMGADAVRLRVFVNPPAEAFWTKPEKAFAGRKFGPEKCMLGFCDKNGMLELAKRAKALGMRLMVDFHYSDHFADPVFQDIPEEWKNDSYEQLSGRVAGHTREVLELLKSQGVYPEWVQVGNELNTGLLLPVGSTRSAVRSARLSPIYPAAMITRCARTFLTFFSRMAGQRISWDFPIIRTG